jgi:hypothetical protein
MWKALGAFWQAIRSFAIGTAVMVVVAAMLLAVTVRDIVSSCVGRD